MSACYPNLSHENVWVVQQNTTGKRIQAECTYFFLQHKTHAHTNSCSSLRPHASHTKMSILLLESERNTQRVRFGCPHHYAFGCCKLPPVPVRGQPASRWIMTHWLSIFVLPIFCVRLCVRVRVLCSVGCALCLAQFICKWCSHTRLAQVFFKWFAR